MSLSFREKIAILVWSTPRMLRLDEEPEAGTRRCNLEAAKKAQDLADACCEIFGHDVRVVQPLEIGSETIALRELNRLPAHTECARCGKRETTP